MTTTAFRPRAEETRDLELSEKLVSINRVSKVIKGGRRFSFSALVVVGDENGHVGVGMGKANEVPEAIRKGGVAARKSLITVPLRNETIPHEVSAKFGAAKVLLKPALPGTGIIAGGGLRAVVQMAGIKNVLSKSFQSANPVNVVKATLLALEQLNVAEDKHSQRLARLKAAAEKPAKSR